MTNQRYLVSRNKREGWYYGIKYKQRVRRLGSCLKWHVKLMKILRKYRERIKHHE